MSCYAGAIHTCHWVKNRFQLCTAVTGFTLGNRLLPDTTQTGEILLGEVLFLSGLAD
jgi:hypothetical protein